MLFSSRRSAWIFAGFVILVAGAVSVYVVSRIAGPVVLDAPPPRVVADSAEVVPVVAASTVEARVTYNLGTAVDSLEAAVPRTFGDLEHRLPIAGNTRANFAYTVSRSPFRVRVSGQTLSISADVEYEARVWYRPPIGPEWSAGCGRGSAPRPRVHVALVSACRLTPDWQLRTSTRVVSLEPYSGQPRDRCRLTVLRIDVTDRVIAATRRLLDEKLRRFDEGVPRWPVRARFERLWVQLQRPIWLTQDVYLEINPYAAQLGSISAVGDTVTARLQMIASPRITTSMRPDVLRPLPPLQAAREAASGARVAVEASFTYPVASALLGRALVGRSLVQDGRRIWIRDVKLAGIGGGRVALGVTLAGRVRGRLYFTGTPSLDPARHQVNVPDLDYDVGTAQLLVESFAWLKGVDMRDFLRERACLPDSAVVGRLSGIAQHGINRTLAPGVTLSGEIRDARGTSVRATTREIRVRAMADAEFKLAIDRSPALPWTAAIAKAEAR